MTYQLVYAQNGRPARTVLQRTANTIVYGRRLPPFSTFDAADIVREALANPNIVVLEAEAEKDRERASRYYQIAVGQMEPAT